MGSQPVIPPPPDGSGIREIPPPPDGSGIVNQGASQEPGAAQVVGAGVGEMAGQLNPISYAKGIGNMVLHPLDALKHQYDVTTQLFNEAIEHYKRGEYGAAAAKALYSGVPLSGENLARSGQQWGNAMPTNDPSTWDPVEMSKAIGSSSGQAIANVLLSKATPENISAGIDTAARKVGEAGKGTSRWLAKSALKPNKGVGSKAQINRAIDYELGPEGGYMPETGDIAELQKASNTLGADIRNSQKGGVVKAADIEKAVNDMKQDLLPSEQEAVDAVVEKDVLGPRRLQGPTQNGESLYRDMSSEEAFDLKVKLQNAARKANKQFYRTGIGTPGVEGRATSAGNIGEQLVEQFPEVKGKNAEYSVQQTLEDILDDAETRISKHEPIPLSGWASGAAGAAAGILHGGVAEGGLAGAASVALAKLAGNPKLRLKAAIALSKASEGALSVAKASARLKSLPDNFQPTGVPLLEGMPKDSGGTLGTPEATAPPIVSEASQDTAKGLDSMLPANQEFDAPKPVTTNRVRQAIEAAIARKRQRAKL